MNTEQQKQFDAWWGANSTCDKDYDISKAAWQAALASQAQAGFSWEVNGVPYTVHGDKASVEQVRGMLFKIYIKSITG